MRVFCEGAADHPIRTRAEDRLRAAAGLQVYLRPADTGAAIARTHRTRGEPWSSRNVAFVGNSPWARRRNLQGQEAVVKLYQAWEPVVTRLYSRYPYPKIMVTDPQHDWQATLACICAAARPSAAGPRTRT